MYKPFDTHSHPQFPHYDKDRDDVIERGMPAICVGTDLKMSRRAVELAQKYPQLWASVGIHPNDLGEFLMGSFEELLKKDKVVAVGEVGLDYYRTKEASKQKRQRDVLGEFIELANSNQKPLIFHFRDAHRDAIEILGGGKLLKGGVAHSFTGTWLEAEKYLELGLYLGFNGIITFARQYDEVVIKTPMGKILLETDAPYLTPAPYRGKRNESAYVIEVAKKIAQLKGISTEEVVKITSENAQKLFEITL